MEEKQNKELGVKLTQLFGIPVNVDITSNLVPIEEESQLGVNLILLFGNQPRTNTMQEYIAKEMAFTDYMRKKSPDCDQLGIYFQFEFSDQSYRWN